MFWRIENIMFTQKDEARFHRLNSRQYLPKHREIAAFRIHDYILPEVHRFEGYGYYRKPGGKKSLLHHSGEFFFYSIVGIVDYASA